MIELSNVDDRLKKYGEAFDFYMESGKMPDDISADDALGAYMQNTIASNPFLPMSDPLWKEQLKGELLSFFHQLLDALAPARQQTLEEKSRISIFRHQSLDDKRRSWQRIFYHIKSTYSKEEVNIEGYTEQFKEHDAQTVLNALSDNWEKAAEGKLKAEERNVLSRNNKRWENHIEEWGKQDYEERQDIAAMCIHYKPLREILEIIGREQPARKDVKDDTVKKYLPLILSPQSTVTEVDHIKCGDDLRNMLPVETAIMSSPDTEILFYQRYATKQLQQVTSRPPSERVEKTEPRERTTPRMEKGPIIVSIDTSGSMMGRPERIAKSLLLQLVNLALKQKRKCYVISFSVRSKHIELTRPEHWMSVRKFMENHFTGGTDGEEMLHNAFDALGTDNFGMADILIISDFFFPKPLPETMKRIEKERKLGTCFYGLQIGRGACGYETILDKIWKL